MKRYKVINKNRFFLFITILLVIFFFIFSILISSLKAHSMIFQENYEELLIRSGDTLWDIALKYKPSKYDVRDMVYKIKELNNLNTSYIIPGEILKVPLITE